jgi:hypothetical protein
LSGKKAAGNAGRSVESSIAWGGAPREKCLKKGEFFIDRGGYTFLKCAVCFKAEESDG